ncbi:hypothetical protein [Streptomyces althioticus]
MEALERTVVQGMRDTGADVGGLYLLSAEERALRLVVSRGTTCGRRR